MTLLLLFLDETVPEPPVEPPVVVENPVRGFKTANRPQFYIPAVKSRIVKFKIPVYWVKKYDIKLDLPVWYQIIYEKKIPVYSIKEEKISFSTSKTDHIKVKLNTVAETIHNLPFKLINPYYKVRKIKKLERFRKLLNTLDRDV